MYALKYKILTRNIDFIQFYDIRKAYDISSIRYTPSGRESLI